MASFRALNRVILLVAALLPGLASAATYVVDSSDDTATTGPLSTTQCPSGPLSHCTLRAAMEAAQASADTSSTIQIAVDGVAVTAPLPVITKSLTIIGTVATDKPSHIARLASVPASGSAQFCYGSSTASTRFPLFLVNSSGASAISVSFQNLNLCFGDVRNGTANGAGGAIRFTGSRASQLSLNKVNLLNNQADLGGGLTVDSAAHVVSISNASFSGNYASQAGGGAYFDSGSVDIVGSTFGPYFATGTAAPADPAPKLPFSASGNRADNYGGGLWVNKATLSLRRSFVVANSAPAGSAMTLASASGATPAATLIGNTIARNVNTGSVSSPAIFASSVTLPATDLAPFVGNIIAENNGGNSCFANIGDTVANTGGYNLFTDATCVPGGVTPKLGSNQYAPASSIFWAQTAGYITTDGIGGFASRGTAPSVLPLVAESPAIDKVESTYSKISSNQPDARGAAAVDGNADSTSALDVGAYEFGGLGLAGFATEASGGFTVTEPSSGDASLALTVKNFAGTVITKALVLSTLEASQTALPSNLNPGTALPDVGSTQRDYVPVNGTIPAGLAAGTSHSANRLLVHSDALSEIDETVKLLLSGFGGADTDARASASGSTVYCQAGAGGRYFPCVTTAATITGNIKNGFSFKASQVTVSEGAGTILLSVLRSGDVSGTSSVTCSSTAGTAVKGVDFAAPDQILVFNPGDTSRDCAAAIGNNEIIGPASKTFTVALSNPTLGTVLSPAVETVTIADNDTADSRLSLAQTSYSVNEGAGSVTVSVTRTGTSTAAVRVFVVTVGDTAKAGVDYGVKGNAAEVGGALDWAAGDVASKSISIPVLQNTFKDGNRQFSVRLVAPSVSSGTGTVAIALPDTASATIVDDDAIDASISVSTTSLGISGAGSSVYSITLSRAPASNVVVSLASNNPNVTVSSADTGGGTVVFPAGSLQLTRSVNVQSQINPNPGPVLVTVAHTVASSDPSFNGLPLGDVSVTVSEVVSGTAPSQSAGGGAFGWSSLLALGSALLMRRRRRH